ncbi:MAG: hypothetical protein ACHQ4H_02255 [Ktedonobacterales bacterium]
MADDQCAATRVVAERRLEPLPHLSRLLRLDMAVDGFPGRPSRGTQRYA